MVMCDIQMEIMNCISSPDHDQESISEANFTFFKLPYHVQIEIVALLSLEDMKSFAATSRESRLLTNEQVVWKKKLWHHGKVMNLCLEGRRPQPREADFLVKDPLLVDMRKLYEVLNPRGTVCEGVNTAVEREDFLSKVHPPQVMSFSSVGLQELLNFLNTFFHRPPPIFYDPFSRGDSAPSFILFGPPESSNARKLALSLIASKNSLFETVGLVKGKPGGLGGGVTVEFSRRLINLLPVRRARPRLLVDGPQGVAFHPDVAQVVKDVDGLIYYLDATCVCDFTHPAGPKVPRSRPQLPPKKTEGAFESSWQRDPAPSCEVHPLDNEFYELQAMLKATPETLPPILVILIHNDTHSRRRDGSPSSTSSASDSDEVGPNRVPSSERQDQKCPDYFHTPADVLHRLQNVHNPWMISRVDIQSLKGVHQGINWLYERTRILKGK